MSLLLESIRIENRRLHNIDLHNKRFNNALKHLYGKNDFVFLEKLIEIPENLNIFRYKCRVTTNGDELKYEIHPYNQRKINTLKVVHFNNINYKYKTTERELLDEAYAQRENCDDIVIIKNGMISDSWAANIILFDGKNWVTPSSPLLKGTQREYLLINKIISEKNIHFDDLVCYKSIKLINAMVRFNEADEIDVKSFVKF